MKCPKNPDGVHRISYPKILEEIIEDTDVSWLKKVYIKYDRPFEQKDQYCMDCGEAIW